MQHATLPQHLPPWTALHPRPAPFLPGSRGHMSTIPQLYQAPWQTTVIITSLQASYGILHLLPKLGLTTLPGTLCLSSNDSHTRQFPFFTQVLN